MKSVFLSQKFWFAVATLVGSTIGIGMYGIPFVFAKSSLAVGLFFFVVVTGLILCTNLLYGEVILRTHRRHQFVGYVHSYLGIWAQRFNKLNFWLAVYGALVGVIIIGGDFMFQIGSRIFPSHPLWYHLAFTALATFFVVRGLRTVQKLDFGMMIATVVLISLLAGVAYIRGEASAPIFELNQFWFLPFGVLLFALNGIPGLPLLREALVGKERWVKPAIIAGTLIPAACYLAFGLAVVRLSGDAVSPDAISGLGDILGSNIVLIGSIFGFLTSLTIFINMATALQESLYQDFSIKSSWRILLVTGAPLALYLLGIRNFINVIWLVGGIAISIDTILLVFVYIAARKHGTRLPEYSIRFPSWLLYSLIVFFALGAVYTAIS